MANSELLGDRYTYMYACEILAAQITLHGKYGYVYHASVFFPE